MGARQSYSFEVSLFFVFVPVVQWCSSFLFLGKGSHSKSTNQKRDALFLPWKSTGHLSWFCNPLTNLAQVGSAPAKRMLFVRLEGPRQTVHRWISSPVFDSFIGFIISVNAGTIGYVAGQHIRFTSGTFVLGYILAIQPP